MKPKNAAFLCMTLLSLIAGCVQEPGDSPDEQFAREAFWEQKVNAALEPIECPAVPERGFPEGSYSGPLTDTHLHIAAISDAGPGWVFDGSETPVLGENVRVGDMACMLDHGAIEKAFVFFPVYDPIESPSIEVVKRAVEQFPGRFVPFLMAPDRDNDPGGYPTVDAGTLDGFLEVEPGLFKGFGESGLYARQGGAAELPPDSQRLLEIYPVVKEHGLVVYFHLGEGQKEAFERVLEANPGVKFIWHGDQLVKYGENGAQDLSALEEILNNHSNAYYGVDELYGDVWLIRSGKSKQDFMNHLKDRDALLEKDLKTWKGFIERHPDQVLWGSDRGVVILWSMDLEVSKALTEYVRAFIGRLDPSVQEKFAYKNAERLIQGKTN